MKIEELKKILSQSSTISFKLPDGSLVPSHFHVTEVGRVTKDFIDCGGVRRKEEVINFQLWSSDDYDHRLHPEKLVHIIELSQRTLEFGDLDIEVEYQGATIGKYHMEYDGEHLLLTTTKTDCLAKDGCMVPEPKTMIAIDTGDDGACCGPGCC